MNDDSHLRRQSFGAHLEELLVRVRRALYWIIAGSLAGYAVSGRVLGLLQAPLVTRLPEGGHLVYTQPFEKIWVYLRVSLVVGICAVSPFVAWEIGQFLVPALKPGHRRRVFVFLGVFGLVLYAGGVAGYLWTLPWVIQEALRFGEPGVSPFLTLSSYINMALGVLLFSALLVEIPIVMAFLSGWGWVAARVWSKGRRPAFVANAIVSAILSPPDALSMLLMMVPVQLLYECGVWGARMAEWARHETPAGASETQNA